MDANRNRRRAILAGAVTVVTVLLILTSATPTAYAANNGGGTVTNSLPTGTRNAATEDCSANDADCDNNNVDNFEFDGTVSDKNGEADMVTVRVTETLPDASTVDYDHTIVAGDLSSGSAPSAADKTVQVWDAQAGEKTLDYNFKRVFVTGDSLGTYSFQVYVQDEGAFQAVGTAYTVEVTAYAVFVLNDGVDAQTYADDGSTIADGRWGGWSAEAGATAVASTGSYKYIKVENTGTASGTYTISFSGTGFVGTTDNTWSIAIDGVLDFEYAVGAATAPNDASLTYTTVTDDADGDLAITIPNGQIAWVRYLIDIPDPTLDQVYEIGYTGA